MEIFAGLEHIVRENEVLAPWTWLRLGGAAEYFAEPTTVDELQELVRRCRAAELPLRVLGGGSNILVRDEGVPGLVIALTAPVFNEISVSGTTVTAGGGAKLGLVVSTSVREGLAGLEAFVGLPGSVGGAIRNNAHAHGSDIGQWTRQVTTVTREGEIKQYGREELHFSYRSSNVDDPVVLRAEFQLEPGDARELTQRMQQLWIIRKSNQPLANQNTAPMFIHPSWATASSLIEKAGLRGTRVGQAEISERDTNFVVANPGSSARDVQRLVEIVRTAVAEQLGVELELSLEIW